jgi:hypothetical protein
MATVQKFNNVEIEFKIDIPRIIKVVASGAARGAAVTMQKVVTKARVPVDTGDLQDSWFVVDHYSIRSGRSCKESFAHDMQQQAKVMNAGGLIAQPEARVIGGWTMPYAKLQHEGNFRHRRQVPTGITSRGRVRTYRGERRYGSKSLVRNAKQAVRDIRKGIKEELA